MQLLKVFLSSTCYDLGVLRETIGGHIKALGHEAIMSEDSIYYESYKPLELSCYNEVANSDIMIHIIGGKFGSESKINQNYSVAQTELLKAIDLRKPIMVFIEDKVNHDYIAYQENEKIFLAHPEIMNDWKFEIVTDYRIFGFVKLIKNKNLPIYTYNSSEKLKTVISNQLSSLFHDRLSKSKNDAREFFDQNYVDVSKEFLSNLKNCKSLSVIGLGQNRMIRSYGGKFAEILQREGKVKFILTDPDGESTKMCAKRSSLNREGINEDIAIHKEAINRLLDIKTKNRGKIHIKVADIMFQYTMYAFDIEEKEKATIYVWFTPLFEPSERRLGFRVTGANDPEIVDSFIRQFEEIDSEKCSIEITDRYENSK